MLRADGGELGQRGGVEQGLSRIDGVAGTGVAVVPLPAKPAIVFITWSDPAWPIARPFRGKYDVRPDRPKKGRQMLGYWLSSQAVN